MAAYFQQDILAQEETKWCDEAEEKRKIFYQHLHGWRNLFKKFVVEFADDGQSFLPAKRLMEITLEVWEQLEQRGFRVHAPRQQRGLRIDEEPNPMTVEQEAQISLVRNVMNALEGAWDAPMEPITALDFEKFDLVLSKRSLYVVDRLVRFNGIVTIGQLLQAIKEDLPLRMCGPITLDVIYATLQEKGYLRFM